MTSATGRASSTSSASRPGTAASAASTRSCAARRRASGRRATSAAHKGPVRLSYRADDGSYVEKWEHQLATEAGVVVGYGKRVEAKARVLTVHHLRLGSDAKRDLRWWNLAALCQRCHLSIQGKVQMERVWPHEHSEWFKPYAAGWYAWSYLGEDLTREETSGSSTTTRRTTRAPRSWRRTPPRRRSTPTRPRCSTRSDPLNAERQHKGGRSGGATRGGGRGFYVKGSRHEERRHDELRDDSPRSREGSCGGDALA
jgi:hypothetical protein